MMLVDRLAILENREASEERRSGARRHGVCRSAEGQSDERSEHSRNVEF